MFIKILFRIYFIFIKNNFLNLNSYMKSIYKITLYYYYYFYYLYKKLHSIKYIQFPTCQTA